MTRDEFSAYVREGMVILDGATGSVLQKNGMPSGVCPEQWILEHGDLLVDIQRKYIESGSNIIYAPTFTGNRIKLAEYGLDGDAEKINSELVGLSKRAVSEAVCLGKRKCLIAGDLTMTGEQLYPIGELKFEELVEVYKEQVRFLEKAGVDLYVVETMMSLQECRAAVLAIKETNNLPVMVTLSFGDDERTLFGTDPVTAVNVLQSMGVDAVGANCSSGYDKMIPIIEKMAYAATIPVIAKPNCGMPRLIDNETVYTQTPDEFADGIEKLIEAGATIVGGCCGTDAVCINKVSERVAGLDYEKIREKCDDRKKAARSLRLLSSERKTVDISKKEKLIIIGERINPTGKKELQASLREGSMELVACMAEEQEEYGADILDVNVGMNGIDEKSVLFDAVTTLSQTVDLPLSIDTSNPEAMEYALRNYPGRALMNSISLDTEKMDILLPMAKKYGAMFVLLPLSEKGLPESVQEKKDIIHAIMKAAAEHCIYENDIVVDGLVATVGANKNAAVETVDTIRYCTDELGVETVCGLSNISFGLPERTYINSAFVTLAISAGLTMAIANPMQEMFMNIIHATDLLLARDESDLRYVDRITVFNPEHVRKNENNANNNSGEMFSVKTNIVSEDDLSVIDRELYAFVVKGRKEQSLNRVKALVGEGITPQSIIDGALIPAINKVGDLYESGRYFLPQLMGSAESMKNCIDYLEPLMSDEDGMETEGIIVIATVKGDIHDIGKNLVAIMLKNCGFKVYDLGKNVAAEDIIEAALNYNADIIGLSALMTTTMMEMKNVVDMAKERGVSAKIMIGGAVVTESFAKEIGADAYSADAGEAVKVAKMLTKENYE